MRLALCAQLPGAHPCTCGQCTQEPAPAVDDDDSDDDVAMAKKLQAQFDAENGVEDAEAVVPKKPFWKRR